jgi:hypothetical protein
MYWEERGTNNSMSLRHYAFGERCEMLMCGQEEGRRRSFYTRNPYTLTLCIVQDPGGGTHADVAECVLGGEEDEQLYNGVALSF